MKEIDTIKKNICNGSYVNENCLVQFEQVKCQNLIKRYLLYKTNTAKEWKGVDCDVSLVAIVTYSMMYDWLDVENINLQSYYYNDDKKKYEIVSKNGHTYRGDTMTSAITFLKKYLYLLWNSKAVSDEYKALFEEYKQRALCIPKAKENYYKSFLDYLSNEQVLNIVDESICAEAKVFLDNHLKVGNFLAVPLQFNEERSGKYAVLDTVDRLLWKIFQYLKGNDDKYLFQLFEKIDIESQKESTENFKRWLDESKINSWDDFIKEHLLEPFVDMKNEDKRPISMKTGARIELHISEDYRPMPESIEEFEIFFRNLNRGIIKRSQLVWHRCAENGK